MVTCHNCLFKNKSELSLKRILTCIPRSFRCNKEAVLKRRCEELQTRISSGHIMTVDQFIELVEERSIIDDDGCGSFADYAANKHEAVWCDVDWLNEHRGEYPFVIWYNR